MDKGRRDMDRGEGNAQGMATRFMTVSFFLSFHALSLSLFPSPPSLNVCFLSLSLSLHLLDYSHSTMSHVYICDDSIFQTRVSDNS